MSQPETQNPFVAAFDVQRTAIRQGQQLFKQGVALQRTAGMAALNGLKGLETLQRQGVGVAQAATHGSLRSMEAAFGVDGSQDQHRTVDEQFGRFEETQSALFDALGRQVELGVEAFDELSAEYVEAMEDQTEEAMDTLRTIEDEAAEDVEEFQEQFGTQLRQGFALTEEVQTRLGEQLEQGTEQAESLLQQQAEQTERFQEQLDEQEDAVQEQLQEAAGAMQGGTAQGQPATGEPATPGTGRRLEDLEGLGSTYADRLRDGGIQSPDQLAAADPGTVAEVAETNHEQAEAWIEQAAE